MGEKLMSDKVEPRTSREKRSKKPILQLTPNQAVSLAEIHLRQFRLAKEWKEATPSDRFPLYSPTNKDTISFYEIKILLHFFSTGQNIHVAG